MVGKIRGAGVTSWQRCAALASSALVTACLVTACLSIGIAAADGLTPHQQLAHDIYKELIEIDTVTATGDTAKAAEAMAARLRAAGFLDADVHVFSTD